MKGDCPFLCRPTLRQCLMTQRLHLLSSPPMHTHLSLHLTLFRPSLISKPKRQTHSLLLRQCLRNLCLPITSPLKMTLRCIVIQRCEVLYLRKCEFHLSIPLMTTHLLPVQRCVIVLHSHLKTHPSIPHSSLLQLLRHYIPRLPRIQSLR